MNHNTRWTHQVFKVGRDLFLVLSKRTSDDAVVLHWVNRDGQINDFDGSIRHDPYEPYMRRSWQDLHPCARAILHAHLSGPHHSCNCQNCIVERELFEAELHSPMCEK